VDLPVCETFIVAIRTTACVSICDNREFQYLQLSTGFSVIFARYKQYVWYGSPASLFHFYLFFLLSAATMEFSFGELLRATGNRSSLRLIGSGGYGSVYLGMLRHTKVAVKFLSEVRG